MLLFTIHPGYGHLHPLLPFAAAARDAGHEVVFATSALFGPVVEATGFASVAAGLDWLLADKTTMPENLQSAPDSSFEAFFAQQFVTATAERLARDVVDLSRTWSPDIIVRERTEFGGSIAADGPAPHSAFRLTRGCRHLMSKSSSRLPRQASTIPASACLGTWSHFDQAPSMCGRSSGNLDGVATWSGFATRVVRCHRPARRSRSWNGSRPLP